MAIGRDFFRGSISEILNGKEFQAVVKSREGIGKERHDAITAGINPLNEICINHEGVLAYRDQVFTRFLEVMGAHNIMLGWTYVFIIPNPEGGLVTVINKVNLMGGSRDTEILCVEGEPHLRLLEDFQKEYGREPNSPYSGYGSDMKENECVSL